MSFWETALQVWVASVLVSLVVLGAAFLSARFNKRR